VYKIIVAKPKEVETARSNSRELTQLAEFSKERCGSEGAVFPMMMMMMMMQYV
jgi:hypothetical protein